MVADLRTPPWLSNEPRQNPQEGCEFSPQIAGMIGLHEAIIWSELENWVDLKGITLEGSKWVPIQMSVWKYRLPFLSEWQIRAALKSLLEKRWIKNKAVNEPPTEVTVWYSTDTDYTDEPTL